MSFKSFTKDDKILFGLNQSDACSWPLTGLWGFRKIIALCENAVFQGIEKLLVKQPEILYNVFYKSFFISMVCLPQLLQGSMSVRWQTLILCLAAVCMCVAHVTPEACSRGWSQESLWLLPVFPAGNMLAMLQAENHTLTDRLKKQ